MRRDVLLLIAAWLFGILASGSLDGVSAQGMGRINVRGGFQTPESVLYDAAADVYLVSNINGNPTGIDNNGFISRVSPNGRVIALKWIQGGSRGVRLNAPKGMALSGNTLYVTDITAVRLFDRRTGRAKGSIPIRGATFLNDAASGRDGSVYVTDSGLKPDFSPSGTDAIYRISRGRLSVVAKSADLNTPNGIAVLSNGDVAVATFSNPGRVYTLDRTGKRRQSIDAPAAQLDGIEVARRGWLISSWETSTVYRVLSGGETRAVVTNVPQPADIGYDPKRDRLLIPLFGENRVVIQSLR